MTGDARPCLPADGTPAWSLDPASQTEREIVERLLQLYLYDFSEIARADVGPDGRFPYPWLDRYWSDPTRHAFLLRAAGRPAGFALVRGAGGDDVPDPARHYLAEFFVMRAHRRAGLGTKLAVALFDRFPGPWWIEQIAPNVAAQSFWRRVVAGYTAGRFAEHVTPTGKIVQRFDTADRAEKGAS